jgi:phage repressor protein C with HTH and peptisase S24 domain
MSVGLGQRIREVIQRFPSVKMAADVAGVSPNQLTRYAKDENEPAVSIVARLAEGAKVSLEWLVTGRGPKELGDAGVRNGSAGYQAESPAGFVLVPRYDVRASAGPGALNDDGNIRDYLAFREDWIRGDLGTSPAEVLCMNAIGDSIEPTIRTGDTILVDRAVTRIADEAIYVVALEEALLLKRVQPLMSGVELRSDNPNYRPVTLSADDAERLRVYGRVRWFGRVI